MKQLRIPGIISILALALVGCGSTQEESEEPRSTEEQQAQDNVDASQQAYEDAYPVAESHIINEYGIMETTELCDNLNNYDDDFDYDAFIDDIMNDAGIEAQAQPEDSPEYKGARDATQDALYDTCDQTN